MTARRPPLAVPGTAKEAPDTEARLRDHFLGWQCRVRQYALRQQGGRPTAGMRPLLTMADDDRPAGQVTVLIVKQYAEEYTAEFRYMAKKTHDPAERYQNAVDMLAAAYYQRAREFSDEMTALFGMDSAAAARLLGEGRCRLDFAEYNQRYRLFCTTRRLAVDEDAYQATYWHNSLFNPEMPGEVLIVGLKPVWSRAEADPPIT